MMKNNYEITGMTCNGCRNHVEKTLNSVEGVKDAQVNLQSETAIIETEEKIDLKQYKEALGKAGGNYDINSIARPIED